MTISIKTITTYKKERGQPVGMTSSAFLSYQLLTLQEVDDFADVTECHAHMSISSTIVDSYLIAFNKSRAREHYIRHITHQFVRSSRSKQVFHATVKHLARIFLVEQYSTHSITETVASSDYTVVEQQPAFVCQDRHITCTNLCALPPGKRQLGKKQNTLRNLQNS